MKVLMDIEEKDMPDFLKECIDKIEKDKKCHPFLLSHYEVIYKLDSYFKRVHFELDKTYAHLESLKLHTMMELYYFWEIEYDSIDKLFKVGGGEVGQLTSKTLSGLINKICREFKNELNSCKIH